VLKHEKVGNAHFLTGRGDLTLNTDQQGDLMASGIFSVCIFHI
jgi:hypothetical protein